MVANLFDISGRVIVVTGGLGQLGRQFAAALLEQGARVAVVDLDAADKPLPPAFQAYADNCAMVSADVTERASLESALARIEATLGVPYGLVNNAALDSPPNAPAEENGPFETFPVESWERVMDVNVKGVFLACQVFGAAMAAAGRGSIINIGSTYGLVSPDHSLYEYRRRRGENFYKPVAYSASKSALINLTRYLGTYWGPQGVRVNLLAFGGVFNQQDAEFLQGYHARCPLGRMAREDEYNGAVVFLMSDAASYMTGSTMVLDGGWTAW